MLQGIRFDARSLRRFCWEFRGSYLILGRVGAGMAGRLTASECQAIGELMDAWLADRQELVDMGIKGPGWLYSCIVRDVPRVTEWLEAHCPSP